MGEIRNAYKILTDKSEGNITLVRSRRRWEDNIKIYLKEIGCGFSSCGSRHGSVAGCCEYGNEASDAIKCEKFLDWLSVLSASQEEFCSMELFFLHDSIVTIECQSTVYETFCTELGSR
jgi:hypothetical protein